jgi:hypothetical protein
MTGSNISISDALSTYTERRLRSVAGSAFRDVEVRLSDVNGPIHAPQQFWSGPLGLDQAG